MPAAAPCSHVPLQESTPRSPPATGCRQPLPTNSTRVAGAATANSEGGMRNNGKVGVALGEFMVEGKARACVKERRCYIYG